jgi:hypothetical protein
VPRQALGESPRCEWLARHLAGAGGAQPLGRCPEGLRYGFGVQAVSRDIAANMMQRRLGNAQLTTTAIHENAAGEKERSSAARHYPERRRPASPFILVLAPKKAPWARFDTRSMDGQRLYPVIRAIVDRTRPATGPNPAKAVQSNSPVKSRLGRHPQLRRNPLTNATVAR